MAGGSSFEFNERGFKKLTQQLVKDASRELDELFLRLGRQYHGKPTRTIKPVLRHEVSKLGVKLSDRELSDLCTADFRRLSGTLCTETVVTPNKKEDPNGSC